MANTKYASMRSKLRDVCSGKTTCTYFFRNGYTLRDIYSGKQLALTISEIVIHWETFSCKTTCTCYFRERHLLGKTTCTCYFINGHTLRNIFSRKQLTLAISEMVIHWETLTGQKQHTLTISQMVNTERHLLGKTTCTCYSRNGHTLRNIFLGKQLALTLSEMVIHWETFSWENNLHLLFQKWSYTEKYFLGKTTCTFYSERHFLGKTTCTYYFRNGYTLRDIFSAKQLAFTISEMIIHWETLLGKTTRTYYFRNGYTMRDIYSGKQTCTYYFRNGYTLRDIFSAKQLAFTISEMIIHWETFTGQNNTHLLFQKWLYTERYLLG